MTAEVGRQPWLIYGLMRTARAFRRACGAGNVWFTLIGFMGMYIVLAILFLFLVYREIENGPEPGVPWRCGIPGTSRALRRRDGNDLVLPRCVDDRRCTCCSMDSISARASCIYASRATDAERRQVLASIGPVWDGNEVWLLAAGGTLYFAFPALYAAASADSICR